MIRMGQSTPDDQLEVDGMSIQNVIIFGRLVEQEVESMRTLFELNDGTHCQKVIFYKKGDAEVPKALQDFEYKENTWVKVMGTVRVFKEETAIVGNKIEQVVQHDEVTNHFLQIFVA